MVVDLVTKVQPYMADAKLVAWDGCHKIYLALDDTEADWFRVEYPHVVEANIRQMLAAVKQWWNESCGLRFVQGVRHNATDPNAGFISIIDQFEDEDGDW